MNEKEEAFYKEKSKSDKVGVLQKCEDCGTFTNTSNQIRPHHSTRITPVIGLLH